MLTVGCLSRTGKTRDHNEDSVAALDGQSAPHGTDALLVVADGMGGHSSGEVASDLAVKTVVRELSSSSMLAGAVTPGAVKQLLELALTSANRSVYQEAQSTGRTGMGTTLTAVLVRGESAFVAHVGDSNASVVSSGVVRNLTARHSWVEEQVAAGVLSSAQARKHPMRNLITKALGVRPEVQPDITEATLEPGDIIVITSDGIHEFVSESEIARTVSSNTPQRACGLLADRSLDLGGDDDRSVIVAAKSADSQTP